MHAIRNVAIVAALAVGPVAVTAGAASAQHPYFPHFRDGSQAFNSGVIAGAGPNWYSTFIRGERCEFRYRVVHTQDGPQKLRYQVCY